MEDILRAIALGIVQGLTEFLPISSSGHLIIVRELFDWQFADDLTFDVALHVGTTAGVLAYFWREWLQMARSLLRLLTGDRERRVGEVYDARLFGLIALGSLPVAAIGFAFKDTIEDEIRDPVVVGCMLIAFAAVLFLAERLSRGVRAVGDASWRDAVLIGAAQAVSLVPGVSRSGVTISAGLFGGFSRQDAARFSFLLSTPAIAGAALLTIPDAASEGVLADELDVIIAGAVTSAVVGWLSIAYLMRLLQTRSFLLFVVYRVLAGAFAIAYFAA
jgi:undecaprenyl-diphosphatase